jgi:hypothetical protein
VQEETYPCEAICVSGGNYVHGQRREYRCALPGFPRSEWKGTTRHVGIHMGRLPILQPTQEDLGVNLQAPPEMHDEGCPGAWYRCDFVRSLWKYERLMTDSGYSPNIMLDRCDDPLVLEAIQYLENERLRARSADMEKRYGGKR